MRDIILLKRCLKACLARLSFAICRTDKPVYLCQSAPNGKLCVVAGGKPEGCYLYPHCQSREPQQLTGEVHSFTVFTVHANVPYVRQCWSMPNALIKGISPGSGFGWPTFLATTKKAYPAEYQGPFMLGVCWQLPIIKTYCGVLPH